MAIGNSVSSAHIIVTVLMASRLFPFGQQNPRSVKKRNTKF